jgi:phage baseplate assembly protein W|tara:strand:+ start:108 stop:533 length:426 start_codon:yes stop_codon:yes gene_type:complete
MPAYDSTGTNNSNTQVKSYKDLDLDFGRNVVTNDVNKLTGVEAVKRSVRNLIQTNHFERPFHPELGGNVRALLFEPLNMFTAMNLEKKIAEVLLNFEPRAQINQVRAEPNVDQNSFFVSINFKVVGIPGVVTVETMLERLR